MFRIVAVLKKDTVGEVLGYIAKDLEYNTYHKWGREYLVQEAKNGRVLDFNVNGDYGIVDTNSFEFESLNVVDPSNYDEWERKQVFKDKYINEFIAIEVENIKSQFMGEIESLIDEIAELRAEISELKK